MRLIRILLLFFGLPILATRAVETANPSDPAPFGLKWGMSVADAKALGVMLSDPDGKEKFGISYRATNLPKILPDADLVALSFGFEDKLWRIVVIGQKMGSDPYGNGVKARYRELSTALSEKYGRGNPHEYQAAELWKKADEFLTGINVGRSWYYNDFDSTSVFVQLGIMAEDANTANWRIIYELKSLRALFEKGQKAHEKDAL
jgi:hypothetical protein